VFCVSRSTIQCVVETKYMSGRELKRDIKEFSAIFPAGQERVIESNDKFDILMPLWSSPLYVSQDEIEKFLVAFGKECHFNNLCPDSFITFVTLNAREQRLEWLKDKYKFFGANYDVETAKAKGVIRYLWALCHQYICPSIRDYEYKSELAGEAVKAVELCQISRY
jgi:hypothetical protein